MRCPFCSRSHARRDFWVYTLCACGAHVQVEPFVTLEPLYPAHARSPSPWAGRP